MTQDDREVVVITGGAGGMGLAAARRLGADGPVLVSDIGVEQVERAVAGLHERQIDAHGFATDVTAPAEVSALAARACELGSLRTIVHAAGAWHASMTPERIFDVNYFGAVNVLDAFLPLARAGTAAICISSIGGHRTVGRARLDEVLIARRGPDLWPHLASVATSLSRAYTAAKRGVVLECELRAEAWGRRGARILSISPGNFDTAMGRAGRQAGGADMLVEASSPKRSGTPEEMAEIIAFLSSADAAYISGCDIRVDGAALPNMRHAPRWREAYEAWNGVLEDDAEPA